MGDNLVRSLASLRRSGALVVIPSAAQLSAQKLLDEVGVTATWMLVEPDYAALESVARMMADGSLRVVVGASRPREEMAELHAIGGAGGPLGKLVATVG